MHLRALTLHGRSRRLLVPTRGGLSASRARRAHDRAGSRRPPRPPSRRLRRPPRQRRPPRHRQPRHLGRGQTRRVAGRLARRLARSSRREPAAAASPWRQLPKPAAPPAPTGDQKGSTSNPINMAFVPSADSQKVLASGQPLAKLLHGRDQPELQGLGADVVHRGDRGDGLEPGRRRLAGAVRLRAGARQERQPGHPDLAAPGQQDLPLAVHRARRLGHQQHRATARQEVRVRRSGLGFGLPVPERAAGRTGASTTRRSSRTRSSRAATTRSSSPSTTSRSTAARRSATASTRARRPMRERWSRARCRT